ncbi:MAG: hypothetical protein ARM1_0619 [Candidatus Micrarchaeota archaeon]|nr:MAG: hypothetical protein ARM1_0619 [Candidatus Micrarchaeota archaeon]
MAGNSFIDSYKRAIDVILDPVIFTNDTMNIKSGIVKLYTIGLIPLLLCIIINILFGSSIANSSSLNISFSSLPLYGTILALLEYIPVPFALLIYAAIYHLIFGKILRIYRSDFSHVYTAFVYGGFPYMLQFWLINIPALAFVVIIELFIATLNTLITALSNQLGISTGKAFGTFILLFIITVIILTVETTHSELSAPLIQGLNGSTGYGGVQLNSSP